MATLLLIAFSIFLVGAIYLFSWMTIDGNYLNFIDRKSKIYDGILTDFEGTANTSRGGQVILLYVEVSIDDSMKRLVLRESHDITYISKLYIGKSVRVRYSPKFGIASTVRNSL